MIKMFETFFLRKVLVSSKFQFSTVNNEDLSIKRSVAKF